MDCLSQLLDTWRINNRLCLDLLEAIPADRLSTPLAKGKAVSAQFAHIHNVRLMWLKASAPDGLGDLTPLEPGNGNALELAEALGKSGDAMAALIESSAAAGGRVKNFKPHLTAFVCYLVAHEANHRGQVELALRQAGDPLPDKVAYGLWEWGRR